MNMVNDPLPSFAARALRGWVSPSLFDFWAGRLNRLWTLQQPLARLVARRAAGRDAVTLTLRPNRHWRGMRAGQHVNLGVEIDGRRLLRSYSPTELSDGRLEITVKAIAGGVVSSHLMQQARIGDVLALEPAFGDMCLPSAPQALLLLAAGSGITPMRALLRELVARNMPCEVDLLYWARSREELCFVDELQALAAAHPCLRLRFLLTREDQIPAARIDTVVLDDIVGLAQRHVMACGPGGFVAAARARLEGRVARFQAEAFSMTVAADGEEGDVRVELARSGRTLRLARNKSLLEGLEAHGLRPQHGCRMGICNSCACSRQSGITRHLLSGERSSEPLSQVRLCVSAPSTDLILDL